MRLVINKTSAGIGADKVLQTCCRQRRGIMDRRLVLSLIYAAHLYLAQLDSHSLRIVSSFTIYHTHLL